MLPLMSPDSCSIVHSGLYRSHFQYAHRILSTTLSCRSTPVRMSTRSLISSRNSRPISPGSTCWAVCRSTCTSQRRSPCSLYDNIPCLDGVEAVSIRSMFLQRLACLHRRAMLVEPLTAELEPCDQASCPWPCHHAYRILHRANGKARNTPECLALVPQNCLEVSMCMRRESWISITHPKTNSWLLSKASIPPTATSTSTLVFWIWISRARTRSPLITPMMGFRRSFS